jgi:WD40 repeat protein
MNGQTLIWDPETVTPLVNYAGSRDGVRDLAWAPAGKQLAIASNDKSVQILNLKTGKCSLTYHGHQDAVTSVAWSPDGISLASGSKDKKVHIWRAPIALA